MTTNICGKSIFNWYYTNKNNNEITLKTEESKSKSKINSDLARVLYNMETKGANKKSNQNNGGGI